MKLHLHRSRAGVILFEAMLATSIFALAVLALGRCVDNCIRAEILLQDQDRARRALENRMNEIEGGAVKVGETTTDELKGMFAGMKLRQARTRLKLLNEKKEEIPGLDEVTLDLSWDSRGEARTQTLKFYVARRTP